MNVVVLYAICMLIVLSIHTYIYIIFYINECYTFVK